MVKTERVPKRKPKKKTTAYHFFMTAYYREHCSLPYGQTVPFSQMSATFSKQWKAMTEEQKAPFVELAAEDEQRYNADLAKFIAAGGSLAKVASRRRKKHPKPKDPNKPKRPTFYMSAFFHFANEKRGEVKAAKPQLDAAEISWELRRLWKKLSTQEKHRFKQLHERDKARYEKEMEEYIGVGGSDYSYRRGQHSGAADEVDTSSDDDEVTIITLSDDDEEEGEKAVQVVDQKGHFDANGAEKDASD